MQRDRVPHRLGLRVAEPVLERERPRRIGARDLEAAFVAEALGEAEVVEQRRHPRQLGVTGHPDAAGGERTEHVGAHAVVEQPGR